MGVSSGRAAKPPGKLTGAAPPARRPVQFVGCCWYFLGRGNILGNNSQVALPPDFRSAPGPSLMRGYLRWGNRSCGDTAVAATSLTCCAGVGFPSLLGDVCRGDTQRCRFRRSASLNFFADVTLTRPRGRRRQGDNRGDSAETATSLNYCAGNGLRRSRIKNATGHITEAALQKRHLVGLFRVVNSPSWAG